MIEMLRAEDLFLWRVLPFIDRVLAIPDWVLTGVLNPVLERAFFKDFESFLWGLVLASDMASLKSSRREKALGFFFRGF